ncbi:35555_t:CDS:2, partial [Racocetra persica]
VARTKQLKQRQVLKIHSSIRKAKKIWPAQFRRAANKLFKINKKEYNASFVKLATDISNIGQTFIHATNKEIAALSLNQNLPKDTSSRFFGYSIMANESTREEKKILIICFSCWDINKLKSTITIVKVTDITCCNAETVSTTVFETCKEKGIDSQKWHYWVTDNTAYMSSEANGAIAKFNSLAISQSFRIPCGLHATHIALMNFKNMVFGKLDSIKELSLKEHLFNLLNLAFHLYDRYNLSDKDSLLNLKLEILKKLYKAMFNFEICKYQQPIRQWWLYELKTTIQYLDHCELTNKQLNLQIRCLIKFGQRYFPLGNHAHEMPDKIIIWIQELQYYLEDIYRLFEDKLVDVKCELNAIDFENFYKAL